MLVGALLRDVPMTKIERGGTGHGATSMLRIASGDRGRAVSFNLRRPKLVGVPLALNGRREIGAQAARFRQCRPHLNLSLVGRTYLPVSV
jgi:hypothetical protein